MILEIKEFDDVFFKNQEKIKNDISEVVLGNEISEIPDDAFNGFSKLKRIHFSDYLKKIGKRAFYNCSSLSDVSLPKTLEKVDKEAFFECEMLRNIDIFSKKCFFEENAFANNTSLQRISFYTNGISWDKDSFKGCSELLDVDIFFNGVFDINEITDLIENNIHEDKKGTVFFIRDYMLEYSDVGSVDSQVYFDDVLKNLKTYFDTKKSNFVVLDIDKSVCDNGVCINKINISKTKDELIRIKIPSYLNDIIVNKIGEYIFESSNDICEIDMSDTVSVLGEGAFYRLGNLKNIFLSSNIKSIPDYCFYGCESLKNIILSDNISVIGNSAFENCSGLRYVISETNNIELKRKAFFNCFSLESIKFNSSIDINYCEKNKVFEECNSIKFLYINMNSITEDKYKKMFISCKNIVVKDVSSLNEKKDSEYQYFINYKEYSVTIQKYINDEDTEEIYIPNFINGYPVKKIGKEFLMNNKKVKKVVCPNYVRVIECGAFKGCNALEVMVLPKYLEEIKDNVFRDCENLTECEISPFIEIIGNGAFFNCKSLEDICLPKTLKKIGCRAFFGCERVSTIDIPLKIREIYASTFENCKNLARVKFSTELEKIYAKAFYNCYQLCNISIPKKVNFIGESAFENCINLLNIIINSNIVEMDKMVFSNCNKLENITAIDNAKIKATSSIFNACNNILTFTKWIYENDKLSKIICFERDNNKSYNYSAEEIIEDSISGFIEKILYICKQKGEVVDYNSIVNSNTLSVDEQYGEIMILDCDRNDKHGCNMLINEGCLAIPKNLYGMTVTIIADSVFAWNNNIMAVYIPNTVRKIGSMAFMGCINMKKVFFEHESNNVVLYEDAFRETNDCVIYINNDSVRKVFNDINCDSEIFVVKGKYGKDDDILYEYDDKNSQLTIRYKKENEKLCFDNSYTDSWESIKDRIKKVVIEDETTEIKDDKLKEIKDHKITEIKKEAFKDCNNLEEVVLGKNVTTIGEKAFYNCTSLSKINITSCVKNIGKRAFYNCKSLWKGEDYIELPYKLEVIPEATFYGCESIKKIFIGENINTIMSSAFMNCTSLSEINFKGYREVENIGSKAFCNLAHDSFIKIKYDNSLLLEKNSSNNTKIIKPIRGECGDKGTNVTWNLFYDGMLYIKGEGKIADYSSTTPPWQPYLLSIKSLYIDDGISIIGDNTFSGINIEKVEIGNKVSSIGKEAFAYCNELKDIRVSSSIRNINENAFAWCDSLENVYFMPRLENDNILIKQNAFGEEFTNKKRFNVYVGNEASDNFFEKKNDICNVYLAKNKISRKCNIEDIDYFIDINIYDDKTAIVCSDKKIDENMFKDKNVLKSILLGNDSEEKLINIDELKIIKNANFTLSKIE